MKKSLMTIVMITPLVAMLFGCSTPADPDKPETPVATPVETATEAPGETPKAEDFEVVMNNSEEMGYYLDLSTEADLDGDGVKENIVLKTYEDAYSSYDTSEYDLFVDDLSISVMGEMINPVFNIVDILKEDKYLEIAVSEEGPSSDYITTFFRYDGKSLHILARIEGYYGLFSDASYTGDMVIDGSGTVKTSTRGVILQTWFYEDTYELREGDEFVHIVKDLYPMETEVTILKDLKTIQRREYYKDAFVLRPGENAIIMETDNKAWVSIQNSQGRIGWFYVDDFYMIYGQEEDLYATEYFDGLIMAD